MSAPVRLYHYWRSSSAWRVRWALAIKGIAFESAIVDLAAGQQLGADQRARNPIAHVPTLEIDGLTLSESVAILEYLDDTRPTPALYPTSAAARARTRQVVELINSGIQPLQNLTVLKQHTGDAAGQKAWAAHFNQRGLAALESTLVQLGAHFPPGPFALGDRLSVADLYLVPQVYSARRFGVDLTPYPRVLAAEAAALASPHAASALPENQPGAPRS